MPLTPPQAYRKTAYTHRAGDRADQPLASDVLEGTLYYVVDEGILERSDGIDWNAYTGAGARTSNLVNYTYSATTTSPPATKQVRFNAGHPYTTVTKLFFDNITLDAQNIRVGLLRIPTGSLIYVQDKNDSTKYGTFTTTAFPTDHTTWVEFDVVWVANGSAIGGGSQVLVQSTWGSVPTLTFTAGSVIFAGSTGVPAEDNANFFFDNTNNRLGIRTAAPAYALDILRDNITNTTNADAAAIAYRNTQAATSGAQTQHAPSMVYEGHAWQSSGGGSDKQLRIVVQGRVVPAVTGPSMFLSFTSYNGTSFQDEIYMGAAQDGDAPGLRFRDGNILFKNSGRGISFVSAPLTDAPTNSFTISGDVSGGLNRIKFTPVPGYVFIEGNNAAATPGSTPSMDFRNFDGSTAVPIVGIRHRATKGGGPSAGFGTRQQYQADSTTTADQNQGAIDMVWSDPTHATRSADLVLVLVDNAAAQAEKYRFKSTGKFYTSNGQMIGTTVSYTNGAAGSTGTLGNAPAAGDPTKWIPVDDNGTTRYIPAW